jgi:hypothetical protein
MTTAPTVATAPALLNADGSTSMATMFLTAHHGFRRDIALFATALGTPIEADRAHALQDEWKKYCEKLHGHHTGLQAAGRARGVRGAVSTPLGRVQGRRLPHLRPRVARADLSLASFPRRALAVFSAGQRAGWSPVAGIS